MKRFITSLGVTQIFLALLLVIFIMALSTYSIYRSSITGIYEKVKENGQLATQSTIQYFDNTFQTINNLITSIEQMPPYDYPVNEYGMLDPIQAGKLVENLKYLNMTTEYVDEIIVFYDEGDIAITTEGTTKFDLLFSDKYINPNYSLAYWKNFVNSEHSLTVFPATEYQVVNTDFRTYRTEEIMFIASSNRFNAANKNIIIAVDVKKLMAQYGQSTFIPGSSLKVLDQNHNAIFSTDRNLEIVELLNDLYFEGNGAANSAPDGEVSVKKENFEYTIYTSAYNDFVYISKVPYEFQNLKSVALGNRSILLIGILSAVLLAVLLSIYLFKPVKGIMKMLGGENSKGNDFSKIKSAISRLQTENKEYQEQLNYMGVELRRNTFLRILDDYSFSAEYDRQLQTYYSQFFQSSYFMMALLQVREKGTPKGYSLPAEAISEKLQKSLAKARIDAEVFHYSNEQFIVLIFLRQANSRETYLKRMNQVLNEAEKEELIGLKIWACLSKTYRTNMENCRTAYKEVENANKYRNVQETSKVMDAEKIDFVWNIYFPYENMEKLSNYILNGKADEGIQIVRETLKENLNRNIHDHQIKYVAKSIFFYLFRNMGSFSQSLKELYEIENRFLQTIEDIDDYGEIERALIEVIEKLAKFGTPNAKAKLNPAFITQYIELHYMENLYLDHIAEVLETTPKYFSNYFKKTFGINYIEYLNKVRLMHAREFLKDTHLSIGEIGEKTGYLNSSTFTTTFKKYYGISPSEYRKQVSVKGEEE